jgi:hypothetical protein
MANEKFKVKFGLAVGDTAATIDATTGEVIAALNNDGQVTIGKGATTNGRIDVGNRNRTVAGTPFIDFNSSVNAIDYDVRLIASGGSATDGQGTLTVTAANVIASNTIQVNGNQIKASDGATNITLTSNTLTAFAGDIQVGGNDIKTQDGTTAITLANTTGSVTVAGNLDVIGGTITDSTGALSITTGAGNGNITLTPNGTGNIALNSANITTTATTANLLNTTATTVNIGGAATTVSIGANTGTTTINNSLVADGLTLTTPLAVSSGGTGRAVGNYSIYANEIHVGKDGNDTTGDGTLINPVLTITKALTLIGAGRNTVIVHPGSYSESPTVSSANTTISTTELTGANTQISGTLTLSAAARVSGIKLTNLTITGSGNTYISNCTVDTQVIKSGSNYVEIINSELQCTSGIQITGAGTMSIVGNKCWAVAISNASANVLIKDCFQVITPSVTAGTLQIDGSAIFAASPSSNAVTSSASSFITLANSFVLNSAGTNVERVSLSGFYSILNLVYDKPNSTLIATSGTGGNLNAIDYFSVVNADTLAGTSGLTLLTVGSNGNITLAPNGTGRVVSGVTQLADNSMVMGSLLATTNSSYTFPAIPITRVTGNNGLDVASSTVIASGNLGYAAQQQLTHYSGDILAGQGSFAGVVLRTANGNSVTGSTLPFTGLAQAAASGLVTGDAMGALSFNGYATTDFTDFLGTRNQGGGFIGANSMQIQGIAAENFVDSTLTISGATITAVSRVNSAMSSVTVTGTRGQISFTATTPSVGQAVNVTGTNVGTSTGISAGVYYIVAVVGTTAATLSATPGGVPITTTAGTTTGLSFARRFITVTFTAQSYIPFGLNAFVTVSGITGATDGTYMTFGSGTTTTVNIGVSTASVALSGTQSLSTPTVTNAGSALRIRSIPVATPLNSSNRIDIVDHRPSAAIYRADSFTFNTGAYGNTGTSLLTIDSSGNVIVTGNLEVNGNNIQNSGGTSAIILTSANATTTIKGDAITLEDNAGTDYLLLNSTSATFAQPVQFPNKTAAQWNAITGAVGMQVCVNNSPVNAGKMAYWDTTNARWSYVDTNTAI